jgi:hypothetical protein
MVSTINPNRLVPVQEDLTTPQTQLEIIRGWENMFRVDKPLDTGAQFVAGEWGVLTAGGLARPTTTPSPSTYLVIAGTDRFDAAGNEAVTIVQNSKIIVRSSLFDAAGTYAIGTPLTVKDLGAGQAFVTPAVDPEPVLARVVEAGTGYLVYEVL